MNKIIFITAILINIIFIAGSSLAEKKQPLVWEPNKYSYTFAVPDDWEFSWEQANQFGMKLLYFQKGANFHNSNSIIYVNELCSLNCKGTLNKSIQTTIDNAKGNSPNLQISKPEPIKLEGESNSPVLILTGFVDPRQAKEALAFIEHNETVVLIVLTTKDVKNWKNDYKAFEQIVGSHKFFNCDSPNLAVPCR